MTPSNHDSGVDYFVMAKKQRIEWLPYAYLALLTAATAYVFYGATPSPADDHFLYQAFIESLAAGKLDLTIPGFHGTDMFGLVIFWITNSPLAQIYGLMIPALLLPLMGFLAGRALFKSTMHGILLASIVTMMPFISFVLLRGWTGPGYWFWMLLTVWLAAKKSPFTGIPWALAILTKPFAIILLPLIIVQMIDIKQQWWKHPFKWLKEVQKARSFFWIPVVTALVIVDVYLVAQYLQAERIFVGAHADMTASSIIQSPLRIVLNLAHSLQIIFSVHNYYYPVPALTGPGNLMHTSPVIIFLGLFGAFAWKNYWKNIRMPLALAGGAALGIVMNALLDHMDHFYMEASVFLMTLAALPVLMKHRIWIPIALATLHFQWFYFYLQNREGYGLGWRFFLIPALVDVCFGLWIALNRRKVSP